MGKLMKNGVNYSGFGSPGGSTVEVTPIQTTGTKIATIEVDGVEKDLYAPSGGGGGGTVHWSTPGAEQSGAYPRLVSNNKTLNMSKIISESGSETVYVVQSCSYDWELRGTLPSDLVIGKEVTLQMYEGQNAYPTGAGIDFSNYLTLTLDPTTSGLTLSNVRFSTSSLTANGSNYTLQIDYRFDATYAGQTMEDQYLGISINVAGTSVTASTGYSYLEV